MAGSDTFRGCSFQAAYCVGLALDVLEGRAETLVLEGDADIVDAALESPQGVLQITQAKTKREPGAWRPQEIADVICAWQETAAATAEHFEFVTDGSLGPGVVERLAPALLRAGAGATTAADRRWLRSLGLTPDDPALGRVRLHSRLPDGRALLEQETLRAMELRERVDRVTVEQGRDLVWRLFARVVFDSGEHEVERRRLDRAEIAEIVGVPLSAIDDADPWSAALEEKYRTALGRDEPNSVWTLLKLLASRPSETTLSETVPLVKADEREDNKEPPPVPATVLLEHAGDALIHGPAGAGKTTTLTQLQAAALERGLLPIHLRIGEYTAGRLERLLRRVLENVVERPLTPAAIRHLLGRDDVLVLLDGAGELIDDQRTALVGDLLELRSEWRVRARIVLVAREARLLKRLDAAGFAIQPIDGPARRTIASRLVPGGADLVAEIEEQLGDVVDNPLLFTLAVSLHARGERPRSRVELLAGFVAGLETRREGDVLSVPARAAAEVACYDLRRSGRYSADRWWWLDRITVARAELIERGTVGAATPTADRLLSELERLGLMRRVGDVDASLALLHDLFCDWFAAEAVRHRLRKLPDPVEEPLEEAVLLLAERDALDDAQLLAIAGNAVAAARAADVLPASKIDPGLAEAIWERLRAQLAPHLATQVAGLSLRIFTDDPPWACLADASETDPRRLAMASPIACIGMAPVSSLSIAVDLWLGLLRLSSDDHVPVPPRQLGEQDHTEEITDDHRHTVEQLAERLLAPPLVQRLIRVSAHDLRGWVPPPLYYSGGEDLHRVFYRETLDTLLPRLHA
jgi:hypothetical protein